MTFRKSAFGRAGILAVYCAQVAGRGRWGEIPDRDPGDAPDRVFQRRTKTFRRTGPRSPSPGGAGGTPGG